LSSLPVTVGTRSNNRNPNKTAKITTILRPQMQRHPLLLPLYPRGYGIWAIHATSMRSCNARFIYQRFGI
jgi:hypothetical protein